MPKEQPCLNEHSPCAASSKNAKDKSNSTTLLAIRDTRDADNSGGRGSRCSSEKDSGYSDGSDWHHTDVEDQLRKKSQSKASDHAGTSQPSQNQDVGQRDLGSSTFLPAGHDHTPIYIIKDMPGQLLWRPGVRKISHSGSAHMILLQQPSLLPTSFQHDRSSSLNSNSTGKKNDTHLPILKSYPRIAPHPSKKPSDKASVNHESQNISKRSCTGHKNDDTPVTRGLTEQHLHKLPKLSVSVSDLSCSSSTRDSVSSFSLTSASMSQGSPSVSSFNSMSPFLTTKGKNTTSSARHRRFLNTVEILRQSGLLDITLRTKELLRQSNSTERDISQLRQHTELLCQAAHNPGCSLDGIASWEHLHRAMAVSGNYPDLSVLQNFQIPSRPDSANHPESISTHGGDRAQAAEDSEMPPCLLATAPDQNCPAPQQSHSVRGRKLETGYKPSDKVTLMSPDSSTG
ncbi:CLOCK-interacting pacemaker isoform X2 [Mugil cephalus]|uniref:CLOCK-interacting pacemaker isoform X2 n=1 Tax=Mugil cephalus TaxID=48193 RepID=UPI001FB7B140|nr:CLOCK-interacting pacemaker isoform X2 [Mugil cephalus]